MAPRRRRATPSLSSAIIPKVDSQSALQSCTGAERRDGLVPALPANATALSSSAASGEDGEEVVFQQGRSRDAPGALRRGRERKIRSVPDYSANPGWEAARSGSLGAGAAVARGDAAPATVGALDGATLALDLQEPGALLLSLLGQNTQLQ